MFQNITFQTYSMFTSTYILFKCVSCLLLKVTKSRKGNKQCTCLFHSAYAIIFTFQMNIEPIHFRMTYLFLRNPVDNFINSMAVFYALRLSILHEYLWSS